MEIYKLGDEVPEKGGLTKKHKRDILGEVAPDGVGVSGGARRGDRGGAGGDDGDGAGGDGVSGGDGGILKITDMKQGVKNPERVNVFVNGEFKFSLDVAQVVDLKIKVGVEITPEQLEEYKWASEFGKLYQRALEWVLVRPRSERELRDYLKRRGHEFEDLIVSRLIERGYVDDEKFAEFWVENRFVKKGVSAKRLKMELMKKGVAAEVIERVLGESERNDESEIRKIIAKKRARYDDEKLIQYLCRQGFSYDLVRQLVGGNSE